MSMANQIQGLRPDGTLPSRAVEHVQRIVSETAAAGVPIFETLTEALIWEADNPGRRALHLAGTGGNPNPDPEPGDGTAMRYQWVAEGMSGTPAVWPSKIGDGPLPSLGGSVSFADGMATFGGSGFGYGGEVGLNTAQDGRDTIVLVARRAGAYGQRRPAVGGDRHNIGIDQGGGTSKLVGIYLAGTEWADTDHIIDTPGEWHVYVVRFDDYKTTIAIDGDIRTVSKNPGINPLNGRFWIGSRGAGTPFLGDIREVRYYPAPVSDAEVAAITVELARKYEITL